MARVNTAYTLEDILRILREQYEVWEAVRREVLPPSLLDMSENFLRMDDIFQDMVVLNLDPGESPLDSVIYWLARGYAKERYPFIAFEMGLEAHRVLDLVDVFKLAMYGDAGEYDDSHIESFRECLMIEADSPTEGECYIVAEVCRNAYHVNVDQAVMYSRIATRFTGKPAYPAVAAFRRADLPRSYFVANGVHWHRLPRHR